MIFSVLYSCKDTYHRVWRTRSWDDWKFTRSSLHKTFNYEI